MVFLSLLGTMAKAKFLSESEKAVIDQLKAEGYSNRAIALKIHRSECSVRTYMKRGEDYGRNQKTRGNTKISKREKSRLIALASTGTRSSAEIVHDLQLPIQKRQVARILKGTGRFTYRKKMTKPALKPCHEVARLQWAQKYIHWQMEWTRVVFSDEKKFNLDGPDGFAYYWHDLRKEKQLRYSRNFGGGSVMFWAAFSMYGKTPLCKITTRMNTRKYLDMLEDDLVPFLENEMEDDFIYQQDNAAIHVSREAKEWFHEKDVEVLEWPARSPDLNPIENLWGILARKVYAGGRQFGTVQELEVAVRTAWREIRLETLETLVNSMPKRLFDVARRNGKQLLN